MSKGRALVAGGAGFLGSHLCERLLEEGLEVVAIDNLSTGRKENINHLLQNRNFHFIKMDISEPSNFFIKSDYIFHLASPASPKDFKIIPIQTLKAGSYATHNLLEIAINSGSTFFLASTSEIYGDPPAEHHPQKESYWGNVSSTGLRSVYDEAKRYAEAATMAYHRYKHLDTKIVRIFNTYGPRMRINDGRVITNFIYQALTNRPITIHGDGTQTRCFSFVADLIDGFWKLVKSNENNPVNLGTTNEHTIKEIAEIIIELTHSSSEIIFVSNPFEDDPKQRKPDLTKARTILDWYPKYGIKQGLINTIEYIKKEIKK